MPLHAFPERDLLEPLASERLSKAALANVSLGAFALGLPFMNWGVRFAEREELDGKGVILAALGAIAISYFIILRLIRHRGGDALLFRALRLGGFGGALIAGWALYVVQLRRGHPELVFTLFGGSVFGSILGVPVGACAAALAVPLLRWVAKEEKDLAHDSRYRARFVAGRWLMAMSAASAVIAFFLMPNAIVLPIALAFIALFQMVYGSLQQRRLWRWIGDVSHGQVPNWSIVDAETGDEGLPHLLAHHRGSGRHILVWHGPRGAPDGLYTEPARAQRVAWVK